jgi:hypothetical protein
MGLKYDVDSLEALQATLAWSRMKRQATRWVAAVLVVALAIGIAYFGASHQTPAKPPHSVLI